MMNRSVAPCAWRKCSRSLRLSPSRAARATRPGAKHPNWVTYRWPPDYEEVVTWQWKEVVIPYWREAVKFARQHGMKRIALEMHPGFVVYNPYTLLELRRAVGEEIGANCDLSHLFWQGCDPVEVIHFLGKQNAIYHAHMKDTVIFKDTAAKTGVLNFSADPAKFAARLGDLPRRRVRPRRRALEGCRESLYGYRLRRHHEHRKRGSDPARRGRGRARRLCAQKRPRRIAGRKVTVLY